MKEDSTVSKLVIQPVYCLPSWDCFGLNFNGSTWWNLQAITIVIAFFLFAQ
jgi:hypothetical protein